MALTRIGTNAITTVSNSAITLDAAEIPNLDAAKITTGTLANARIAEASVTQHVTATDLQPIKSDISALALREATNESSAAFNLPNQFIDTFTDDTKLGTQTTCDRVNGHIATITGGWAVDTGSSLDTNLIAHYPWDNSDDDLKDTNELTAVGSPTYSTSTKKLGTHALELNADSEQFSFTSAGKPSWGSPSVISFATWAYWNTTGGGYEMLFDGYGDNSNQSFNFSLYDTDDTMQIYDSGGTWGGGTQTVSKNTWIHVAFVLTTSAKKFYYNGSLTNTVTGSFNLGTAYSHNRIGARSDTSHGFGGFLDQTLIWNKEISAQEVTDLYNSGTGNTFSPDSTNATGTLIQSANTVGSAKTKVGGTMLYKDNAGTATLGTDLKIYFTCNGGTNWTEASSYSAITPVYSTGIKQVRLGETTCTSGTDVRYKAVWANQAASSKETQLHGIGVNY